MSDRSSIEWTDTTWNPTTGCTKVSPGCDHCYAKTMHERFNGPDSFETVTLHPDRLDKPLRWRKPRKVFVNSMSDLFHADIPDEYIARIFAVMALAPDHTFQVLTKRHARMRSLLTEGFRDQVAEEVTNLLALGHKGGDVVFDHADPVYGNRWGPRTWPLPNVWLGVSVENQQWTDIRVPALLDTPAAVRFLSMEPLLGPVSFRWAKWAPVINGWHLDGLNGIGWVIVGGESGHGARPMHPTWVRDLRDQCTEAGVPFLFKQWGEWKPDGYGVRAGVNPECTFVGHNARPAETWLPGPAPDDPRLTHTILRRVGKGKAGRELDGRTWDEFPEVVPA